MNYALWLIKGKKKVDFCNFLNMCEYRSESLFNLA